MCLIFLIVAVLITGGYQFQHYGWKKSDPKSARYKKIALVDSLDLWNWTSKGSVVNVKNITEGLRSLDELGTNENSLKNKTKNKIKNTLKPVLAQEQPL